MKLEYKILWLDDKMDDIEDGKYDDELSKHIENKGFNPILIKVKDEKSFFESLDDSYDIILTDYHLNESSKETRNGDQIITEVRETCSIFTEIMFYSAQGEVADTIKKDRITFVDTKRILGSDHYQIVIDKAIALINLTIKKFENIVAMRGMIMHETSVLDIDFKEILKFIIENGESEKLIAEIKEKYKGSNIDFNTKIDSLSDLDEILFQIGSSQRWRGIMRNLTHKEIKEILKLYDAEIIILRNKFAHAVLEKDETGREFFRDKKGGVDFNELKCKEIRENIIKHKKNIDALKEFLEI